MSQTPTRRVSPYQNAQWLWLAALVIVADQITKQLVVREFDLFDRLTLLPVLNLTRLHNTGAAFSILADATPLFFIALSVAVSVGIVVWLRWNPHSERLVAAALSLILGGALGNAIDRAARGHVIDFIDFHWQGWHYPAFNIADIAICVGAGLMILDALWVKRRGADKANG